MSYIITNGTSYCHRTRTQAVEIVTDIDMATRFKDEDSANKLLARATKKLNGFYVADFAAAEAAAGKVKKTRTRRKNAGKTTAAQTQAAESTAAHDEAEHPERTEEKPAETGSGKKTAAKKKTQKKNTAQKEPEAAAGKAENTPEPEAAGTEESTPETKAAGTEENTAEVKAADTEETASEQKASRSRRRRGGRRRKGTAAAENAAETTEADAPEQQTAPAMISEPEEKPEAPKKPAFNFKVEVHTVGTTGSRPESKPAPKAEEDTQSSLTASVTPEKSGEETSLPAEDTPQRTSSGGRERQSGQSRQRRRPDKDTAKQDPAKNSEQRKTGKVDLPDSEEAEAESPYEDVFADKPAEQTAQRGRSRNGRGRQAEAKNTAVTQQPASRTRRSRKTPAIPEDGIDNRRRQFTVQERNLVYNRTEGHCGICGKFIPLEEYTIDHIIPLSKGGTNALDNLQACCGFCNKAKDDSTGEDFYNRIRNIFLYQSELKYGARKLKKLKKAIRELDD